MEPLKPIHGPKWKLPWRGKLWLRFNLLEIVTAARGEKVSFDNFQRRFKWINLDIVHLKSVIKNANEKFHVSFCLPELPIPPQCCRISNIRSESRTSKPYSILKLRISKRILGAFKNRKFSLNLEIFQQITIFLLHLKTIFAKIM